MIQPWKKLRTKPLGDFRIFTLRSDHSQSPVTGKEHEFFVIDCVNWVNVIALTSDDQFVLVEQFRHGSGTIELEIPGGMMDATDASPEVTAMRELREETGYEGQNPRVIGKVFPNPAIMSNTCYTVLIENCQLKHNTAFDHSEDLATKLMPVSDIPELVASGRIKHSLVVVALYHFELWRKRQKR